MATAPVKSQPLHNFSLPYLKWGKNQMNNHRCRKHIDSNRESPSSLDHHNHNHNRSSGSEAESDGGGGVCEKDQESIKFQKNSVGSKTVKNGFSFESCSSSSLMVKSVSRVNEVSRSNLVIRFPKGESISKNKSVDVVVVEGEGNGETVEETVMIKPWNLRPRRGIVKGFNEIGGASRNGEIEEKQENQPKSNRLRSLIETENVEKKEKNKLSILLTREEIEQDFFILTGSKPPRRPKKRNRTIQKQIDNLLPGSWLVGITADAYTVPDVPAKR